MFAKDMPWHVDWMDSVVPAVLELTTCYPERTMSTRFVPPPNPAAARGMCKAHYEKWWMMTGEHLQPELVDVLPELRNLVLPARVFDKPGYPPWVDERLDALLRSEGVASVVVTAGETDVCVTAAIFGAIDLRSHRSWLQSDPTQGRRVQRRRRDHDASMKVLGDRFSVQLDIMDTAEFLSWAR